MGRELRVKGRAVELESKPLDILLQLLLHAGEVVTKEELLEAVWPDVMVVDGSLATAVSKLCKAMGDDDHPVIVTVHASAIAWPCRSIARQSRHRPGPSLGSRREKSYREESNGGCIGRHRVMLNAAGRRSGERGYCECENYANNLQYSFS
jgi:hypothetical protein